MKEVTIQDLPLVELKALFYDVLESYERAQINMKAIREEIEARKAKPQPQPVVDAPLINPPFEAPVIPLNP